MLIDNIRNIFYVKLVTVVRKKNDWLTTQTNTIDRHDITE
jgi:hypothetical protein